MKKYFVLFLVLFVTFSLAGCPKIKENLPPVIEKVSGPEGVIDMSTATFSWSGDDPDGEIVLYEFRQNGENWEANETLTEYEWQDCPIGIRTFEVRAKDDADNYSNIITWEFTVIREMVTVGAGKFTMGDTWGNGYEDEIPVHDVTLTYDFLIGKYQVTFDEFDAFCEDTNRTKPGDWDWGRNQRPVIGVSWWDAIAYCNWLSEKDDLPVAYRLKDDDEEGQMLDANGNVTTDPSQVVGYRLPTEAEWEYAARGGPSDSEFEYSGSDDPDEVAWYRENAFNEDVDDITTWPVGLLLPNALEIYDMSGNVYEWCADFYASYTDEETTDPFVNEGDERLLRGGSFFNVVKNVRVAHRHMLDPTLKRNVVGFRIARTEP